MRRRARRSRSSGVTAELGSLLDALALASSGRGRLIEIRRRAGRRASRDLITDELRWHVGDRTCPRRLGRPVRDVDSVRDQSASSSARRPASTDSLGRLASGDVLRDAVEVLAPHPLPVASSHRGHDRRRRRTHAPGPSGSTKVFKPGRLAAAVVDLLRRGHHPAGLAYSNRGLLPLVRRCLDHGAPAAGRLARGNPAPGPIVATRPSRGGRP